MYDKSILFVYFILVSSNCTKKIIKCSLTIDDIVFLYEYLVQSILYSPIPKKLHNLIYKRFSVQVWKWILYIKNEQDDHLDNEFFLFFYSRITSIICVYIFLEQVFLKIFYIPIHLIIFKNYRTYILNFKVKMLIIEY